jgi:hypothetical protein
VFFSFPCPAGEIAVQRALLINNDDHITGDNPNQARFLSLTGEPSVDRVLGVLATGGVTDYDLSLTEITPQSGIAAWRVELGFGTGDRFVSAATLAPELDFDAPSPSRAPAAGTYQLVETSSYFINFSNGDYGSFRFPIDIPDLPLSSRSFYTDQDLIEVPPGAAAFTIRSVAVPEPGTWLLATCAFIALGTLIATYRYHPWRALRLRVRLD